MNDAVLLNNSLLLQKKPKQTTKSSSSFNSYPYQVKTKGKCNVPQMLVLKSKIEVENFAAESYLVAFLVWRSKLLLRSSFD